MSRSNGNGFGSLLPSASPSVTRAACVAIITEATKLLKTVNELKPSIAMADAPNLLVLMIDVLTLLFIGQAESFLSLTKAWTGHPTLSIIRESLADYFNTLDLHPSDVAQNDRRWIQSTAKYQAARSAISSLLNVEVKEG